jgi:hypothetical protein
MASIRNITYQDQGVNWRVTFEYNNDQQSGPWTEFVASFPADFNEINPDEVQVAMLDLAMAVARGQGIEL